MLPRTQRPDPGLMAAIVAIGSVGSLTALTVLGVLTRVPVWAAVLIVVVELGLPFLVLWMLKRAQKPRD